MSPKSATAKAVYWTRAATELKSATMLHAPALAGSSIATGSLLGNPCLLRDLPSARLRWSYFGSSIRTSRLERMLRQLPGAWQAVCDSSVGFAHTHAFNCFSAAVFATIPLASDLGGRAMAENEWKCATVTWRTQSETSSAPAGDSQRTSSSCGGSICSSTPLEDYDQNFPFCRVLFESFEVWILPL